MIKMLEDEYEFDILKTKLTIMHKLASADKWFHGENIFISAKIPNNNSFYISNLKSNSDDFKCPNFTRINMNDVNFDISSIENVPMFMIHFLIHNCNLETQYITFINNTHVLEVSKTERGLLPISQESFIIDSSSIEIFDFNEFSNEFFKMTAMKNEEVLQEFLAKHQKNFQIILSKNNKLFLKGLGCLIIGKTIEKVYYDGFLILYACVTQVKLGNIDYSNVIKPTIDIQNSVKILLDKGNDKFVYTNLQDKNISWMYGEMEFEALTRSLNNMDLQCGYNCKVKSPWKM